MGDINHIGDLTPDPRNARQHNPRNVGMVEKALREVGAGRSIVIDENGKILAGNATIEAAAIAGIENVQVIKADGNTIIAVQRDDLTEEQKRKLALYDNRAAELADWDPEVIAAIALDDDGTLDDVFSGDEIADIVGDLLDEPAEDTQDVGRKTLAERFIVPPFSVLDARQGYWQERKRAWIALGIKGELGRGENMVAGGHSDQSINIDFYAKKRALESEIGRDISTDEARGILVERGEILHVDRSNHNAEGRGLARSNGQDLMRGEHVVGRSDFTRERIERERNSNLTGAPPLPDWAVGQNAVANMAPGTSIFDPVLCELAYRWFCPPDGHVLDPFAGGSVRGIVAALLGRQYTGIDLSERQIEADREQWGEIGVDFPNAGAIEWIAGDSVGVKDLAGGEYDLVFTCPPYADLEVYSDDPRDISTMEYADFLTTYRAIIADSVSMLRDDRFACVVVGDIRDKRGMYRNFVSDTIAAFQDAGATLYNEAILVTAVGSLPIRVGKQFEAGRKLGKTHQNVLVFVKGDPKAATEACGNIDVYVPEPEPERMAGMGLTPVLA